jgi:hypothetical protein
VTSGGIDGDLWDWSSGISLVGRTDGIGKWKDVGWRGQRMNIWLLEERSHGSLALEWISLLGKGNGMLCVVSLTFLPAHPPRKRGETGALAAGLDNLVEPHQWSPGPESMVVSGAFTY